MPPGMAQLIKVWLRKLQRSWLYCEHVLHLLAAQPLAANVQNRTSWLPSPLAWPGQGGRRQPRGSPGVCQQEAQAQARHHGQPDRADLPLRDRRRGRHLRRGRQADLLRVAWSLQNAYFEPVKIRELLAATSAERGEEILIKGMSVTRAGLAAGQASGVAGETYCRCITRLAGVMATMWQERAEDVPRPGTGRRTRRS